FASRGNPRCHRQAPRPGWSPPPSTIDDRQTEEMIDMADNDRLPFRDLGGIDGESTDSRHPSEIEIVSLFDAGTGPAGRWDQEMEHGAVADPDGATALPAQDGSAGSDHLDFGAGAAGGPVGAEP